MRLKKSLGQNFFNNASLAQKIIDLTTQNNPSEIVEIGPGNGYFTKLLIERAKRVTVVEKDQSLAYELSLKFPNVKVINEDFLQLDISSLEINNETVIFGSLPYNVSKKIIRILTESTLASEMFFIVQKEVAQKYAGREKGNALYILTKLFVDTKELFDIHPGSFTPMPKVTSTFIHMTRNNLSENIDIASFSKLIKQCFAKPRKTLRNNLNIKEDFPFMHQRAQELSFDDFIELQRWYNRQNGKEIPEREG